MDGKLEMVKKLMNSAGTFVIDKQLFQRGTPQKLRLYGDDLLIYKLAGYTKGYTIEEMLKEMVGWFKWQENFKNIRQEFITYKLARI